MAAARIGTPSPVLKPCGVGVVVVATVHKNNACTLELAGSQIGNPAHDRETQLAVMRVRFLVGERLSTTASSNPKACSRGNYYASSVCNVRSASGGAGSEVNGSGRCESGTVHLGRRMLLGTLVTAAALSRFEKPGMALAEGKSGGDKGKSKGGEKASKSGEIAGPPQVGDKWKLSRVYDATVLGEPVAVGGERSRVWQKLLQARVVYLGEAERVPDADDRVLALGIVSKLRDACFELRHPVSLALDAVPVTLQKSLDQYMNKKLSDAELKATVGFWPNGRWQEYSPLLHYCRSNGVRLIACGTPPEVLRTIQAKGIQGLNAADRKKYVPPVGGGFGAVSIPLVDQLALADITPNAAIPYGPGPYHYSQARIVADHVTTQVVAKGMVDGGSSGLLIVITGASHVVCGARGTGVPARVQKKLTKRTQAVVLLNPERQRIRKEGNVPEADFLWYSAARACNRNCFDRAEVARVMDAAGRRRDALPQDIQAGLERGLVDPEVLKSFFELDQHPIIAELTRRFQGLRERWLADPRFLQRLAIEESISITTTLFAQYTRRGDRFWHELDYVITDSVRGAVVDFFTVWLPAPTLSFRMLESQAPGPVPGAFQDLVGLLGSVPDNAFQRARVGESYDVRARVLAVVLGGLKLFGVGVVSSIGTLSVSNGVWAIRKTFNRDLAQKPSAKRSPIFKTAFVYGGFLGLSANLRYQAIAGIVEHWFADYFLASQPLAGSALSFAARIANSYWGTEQWVDLARMTDLQSTEDEGPPPSPLPGERETANLEPDSSLDANVSSTWEQQPPVTTTLEPNNTDAVVLQHEAEPTRTP